ncbi:MAG: hypothetical protein LBS20_11870 [Prevotella sp.]|jgi:hypothetical protein|nr:hypothetical protein [Prevotella sp.]
MNEIIVKYGVNTVIQKNLNVSFPFIRKALRGKSQKDMAMKIREEALKLGGVEVKDND